MMTRISENTLLSNGAFLKETVRKTANITPRLNTQLDRDFAVEITPEIAGILLPKNYEHNRTFRIYLSAKYERIIGRGGWLYNGESIKLAWIVKDDGTKEYHLIDGQHRLTGCNLSGKPFVCDIIWDYPYDAMSTIDVGCKRSAGDQLKVMHQVPSSHFVAATLTVLWQYLKDYYPSHRHLPDEQEILTLYNHHKDILDSVRIVGDAGKALGITPSLCAFFHYVITKDNPILAEAFMSKLLTGIGFISETDPVFCLRETLLAKQRQALKAGRSVRKGYSRRWLRLILIKVWNMNKTGKTSVKLRLGNKEFPTLAIPDELKAEAVRLQQGI